MGAPEGNYKGSVVNNTFRYVMAAIRSLGDAVPKLGAGMAASTTIGTLATKSTVAAADLASAAVTTPKIADAAVTADKLAFGAKAGLAKAWVAFNQAGSIQHSFNVSAVVRNGPSDYTISWDVNFSSANYAVLATALVDGTGPLRMANVRNRVSSSVRVILTDADGGTSQTGLTGVHVVAFGDQ